MKIDINNLDALLFTFFWKDIKSIKSFLENGQSENTVFSDDVDITSLLNLEYAYNPNPLRATFFKVTENTCIMFPKLQDGWRSLSRQITQNMKATSCYMRIMDDKKILLPSNYFTYSNSGNERTVYASDEYRWVFANVGEPAFFENEDYYKNRMVKKRLNKNILIEYCDKLKITNSGVLEFSDECAFSYESYWEGEFADSKGTGSTSLAMK